MNFEVRRHVAAFKARTCPRTPNLSDVDLSCPIVSAQNPPLPFKKGERIACRAVGAAEAGGEGFRALV
jgi:hypothetical protein